MTEQELKAKLIADVAEVVKDAEAPEAKTDMDQIALLQKGQKRIAGILAEIIEAKFVGS